MPKLTVIIVIDQFSYNYINKLRPYLKGGIKFLINNGINYTNAFYPNCPTSTGPGHTMLATGAYGNYHGIVDNKWFDYYGTKIKCEDDTAENAAVFRPDGSLYDYGKSAKNILVDGLSDQLIINSYPHAQNKVWALSIKSRAAICTAGKLGKAIWFDEETGNFTSSKAYFCDLPEWLANFNKKEKISLVRNFIWKPVYNLNSFMYNFKNINYYQYFKLPYSVINRNLKIDLTNKDKKDKFDELYTRVPLANQNLINLAKECLRINLLNNNNSNKSERFILWLSLSSLDKIGHMYGPDSKEAIDMIYHIDKQLLEFIEFIYEKINPKEVLFALTADHGIMPIPEILKSLGLDIARRYLADNIINNINKLIEKKYSIKKIIQNFSEPQFYLNQVMLNKLPKKLINKIYKEIKNYLSKLTGIKKIWTFDELYNATLDVSEISEIYLKRQLHKGRSGQILYSLYPYTMLDDNKKGTSHNTPYIYDTHVPLILYQPGKFMKKNISQNVYMTQFAVTLAQILNVSRPSAAFDSVLPL